MEDKIKELYELIPEGYFNSEQELRDYITDENKLKEVYEFIPKDYFKDLNEYGSYFGEILKKKRYSDHFRGLLGNEGSLEKESTLQSYSQETPITEKDWVGDIAVGAVKPAEKPDYLKIREQNIDAINNLLTDLDKQYEVLNATIIEKEKDPAYQEELSKVLRQTSGAYSPGGLGLSQSIREGMSPARDEIAALKKVAAARDMLLMAKKLNAKSNSELNKDKTWIGKLASSMKNADWVDVFTMGMKNLGNTTELLDAARKAEKEGIESLTTDEQAILVAYTCLQEASSMPDRSVSSMAGESMVASIPFLVQFALTGGVSAGVKGSFTKIGKVLLNKYGKKNASEMIIKGAVGTASLAAEGTVRSLVGVSPIQAVAKRKAETTQIDATIGQDGKVNVTRVDPTEGMAEAAVKGVTTNALEFAFESFGGVVGKGVKRVTDSAAKTAAMKAIGQTKTGRWMSAVNMDAKLVTKAKNQIGFNGFIGETVEELMTSYSQTAVTGDKPVLDAVGRKELLTILMSTATMSGTFATVNGTYKMVNRDKISLDEQVKAELDDVLSKDIEADEVAQEVDRIIATNATSEKDVSNIVQYVAASAQEQANVTVTEFEKGLKGAEADKVEGLLNWDIKQMDEALASTEESSLADAREYDKEMDALDGELAKRVKNERIDALEEELMDVESVERETEIKNELRTLYAEKNAKRTSLIGEIKAETTEVASEPVQEEKVAEMPTVEEKKADIERRRQENPSVERGVLINYESGKTKEQLIDIVNKLKNGEINLNEIIKEFFNLPINTLSEVKEAFKEGTLADKIQFGLDTNELSDLQPKTRSRESIINAKQKALFQKQKTEEALKDSEYKTVKKTDPITGKVTETKVKRTAEEKTKYDDFHKKALEDVNKEIEKYDAELKALEQDKKTTEVKTEQPNEDITTSIIVAPYYDTKVNTIEEAKILRESEGYKQHKEKLISVAETLGLKVENVSENIGGFENEKGDKVIEISNTIDVKGNIDQAERFAAVMGVMTPESQEVTIAKEYVPINDKRHNLDEVTIKVSDINKTIEALKEAEIYNFTIDETGKEVSFIDFSFGKDLEFKKKINNFVSILKTKGVEYGAEKRRPVDSRYVDPTRRGELLGQMDADPLLRGQGREGTSAIIREAKQRHEEFIRRTRGEQVETKVKEETQDAKEIRATTETTGKEEGIKGEEAGRIRVRDVEENRLEAETGKIDEEKGQRERLQVRTWAYEIDDVVEMSIDIESMGREVAKEKVQEYKAKVDNVRKSMQDIITQNRSTLDKISPEYTKHLLRQVANAKPTNLKNTAQRIESIISNAQKQAQLEKAFKQRKKIKEALRNNPEYASFVRSLNVKAKAKDGGKNLAVEFNKVKVESLPEGLVEDYINVVDNLTSKTPNAGMVEDFMKRYSTEIKREAEKASIPNFDPLKTAESLSKQAQELVEGVDMAQATPEAIMSLKRRLSGLLNHAEYLRKQGVMEMTEEDLKEFSQAEDGIKNYIENIIPKVSEEVKGKIEKLEREYKKTAIDNITGRIGNVSLLDALDAEKASKVSSILGKLANDDVSLSRLSLNDLEKLSASLDIMEETGVSPVVLNEVYTKARGIDRARKARGSVFEAIKEKIATRDHVKKLFAKGEDSVQRRMAGKPDWATSALFDIGQRVSGMYSNPIYNDITHVGSEAINTSEKFIKAQVTPIYSVFNKDRQNVFERYVYDYGVNRKEMKPFDKVGILMAQVRVANLMKNYRGRVVARGGMFYAVDVEGNPYRVDEKIKVFKTAEEALDFVKSQPIDKLSNGRELDFFDIVNYDYKEGERVYSSKRKDAKLSNDDKQNEKEKKFMEEAYDELVGKNGGKLNNIRTEEDAKKLLTPEEVKYWDTIRDVYASTESMAGEVAANEGLVLNGEDFYFPMNSKNMSDRAYDQSATLEDIYSQAVQGKSLRVTDNILKKTQRMNYIDFNALRATEKYVRDMSMSYHVLPAMREQVDALNYLVKEYKESDPELASFAKALRRNIVDGYRIEYTRSSMWGNQKLWIRNSSVDVSKMAKALSNAARNLALNKLERFPLDFFPNSIKMGTAAFKPVDKAAWNQFYQYNPGVAGAKGVAEMQYGRNVIGDYNEIASKGVLQEFSDNWIEKGDRVSRQNTWANKFPEVYKKISGKEFDLEKYNSDVNYRNSVNNSEEFEQAKAITDSYIDETLVPTNKYSNRKQMNSLLWTLSSKSRAYNFLNAMSSYTANENAQGFVYFNEAKYNRLGNQGTQNVARMGRLLMSNMAFQVLSQLGYNTSLYLAGLGSDDEKLKEIAGEGFRGTFDTTNLYANGFMSILSVMMGGYMNLGRYMMSLMYNGAKSGIAYSGDDKWRNKVQKYTKSIEQSMGASRVIDPNIDVTKDYTKTEALLNIIVPFYGKKGLEIIKSGVEIPKQGYNYFSMKFAEDQWMKDPYESGEMIRALNVTIGSLINPAVSSMDVGIRNAIKEEFVNRVPADLVDEIIYMDDFELTYKDARQRLSDKYDQVYKYLDKKNKVGGFSIDLYGNKIINEYSAIDSIKDPETFASEKAGKVFSEYLDKGENRKLYDFYDINKDQIDELIATTRAIIKDKKMGKEEREAKYDIIRKEVENLKYAYDQFKKGEMKGSVYITGKDLMNMNVNDMLRKIERKALKDFRIDEEKLNSIK